MTLVDVSAVLAILSQHVAIGAFTVEGSDSVSTPAVATEEGHNPALVDVCFAKFIFSNATFIEFPKKKKKNELKRSLPAQSLLGLSLNP